MLNPVIASEQDKLTSQKKPVFVIARAPQQAPKTLAKTWQPYVDYLSEKTSITFKLRLYRKRHEFEADLKNGTPDFFFMNPYYAMLAHDRHGYIPLLRSGSKLLTGILVVRKDSGINNLQDLQNKSLSFPWPNAFGASLYMRALLAEKEKLVFNAHYVQTHDNVYRSVINGQAAAGGGVKRTLNVESEALRNQLKILYTTPGVAPHPLSAHPRVPEEIRSAVVEATLELTDTPNGQNLLKALKLTSPVRSDLVKDFQSLIELNLGKYATIDL